MIVNPDVVDVCTS